ncbi:hypothetical protein LCGC14_0806150 [marine sediment metagenome]|uniref:Uncharacterized protein n=1 Tax=marine sediment metagenome TaxID=412755 RepID=A0A0F9PN65_9ZZZZ
MPDKEIYNLKLTQNQFELMFKIFEEVGNMSKEHWKIFYKLEDLEPV